MQFSEEDKKSSVASSPIRLEVVSEPDAKHSQCRTAHKAYGYDDIDGGWQALAALTRR
jgi:hypothetical protein